MHFSDKCKEYIGVYITPENIALFNEKVKAQGLRNVKGLIGDATNLSKISDNYFDVVLCLGPLYHLPPDEKELVFAECRRICKNSGIVVFSYINKVGVYTGACVHDKLREYYPSEKANDFILKQNTDDLKPDLFFFTMPEEIELAAKKYGFSMIKNLGTDFFITMSIVETMSDEKFEVIKPLLDQMASYESCRIDMQKIVFWSANFTDHKGNGPSKAPDMLQKTVETMARALSRFQYESRQHRMQKYIRYCLLFYVLYYIYKIFSLPVSQIPPQLREGRTVPSAFQVNPSPHYPVPANHLPLEFQYYG